MRFVDAILAFESTSKRSSQKRVPPLHFYLRVIRRDWTEPELLQALALYYQVPFGSIDARNPAVVALALELERTPGAVGLKLANFASLDPTIIDSGRRGMQNASAADRRIFIEHRENWSTLAEQLSADVIAAIVRKRRAPIPPSGAVTIEFATEAIATVTVRRGQQFFRDAVLAAYRERCCITGLKVRELLRASHIVPWSIDAAKRLDPTNGLCLNALHDAAFDRGLLTLDTDNRLVLSNTLRSATQVDEFATWFRPYEGHAIALPGRLPPSVDALAYHRERIFVDR